MVVQESTVGKHNFPRSRDSRMANHDTSWLMRNY